MSTAEGKLAQVVAEAQRAGAARRAAHEQRVADGRALYSDNSGQPVLLSSFALYIDELGAKQRLASMTDTELREDITRQDTLKWFLHDDASGSDDYQRSLTFSDNIVVASPMRPHPDHEDHGLFYLVFSAAAYQLNMTIRRRPLRGGIAAGPLYADHSFVAGKALVDAVLLEEKRAVYPRILLDEACVGLAVAESRRNSDDGVYEHHLLRDEDGQVFVNYLVIGSEDEASSPGETKEALAAHRVVIAEALSEHGDDEHVRVKYEWMAAYHDYVASTVYGSNDLLGQARRRFSMF